MNKTIIFDLDGTILDTLTDLMNSVNYALSKYHFPTRTLEEVKSFVGNGIKLLVERALPEDVSQDVYLEVFKTFEDHYKNNIFNETAPYPNIIKLMGALKENNVKMAIVSNKFQEGVDKLNKVFFNKYISVAIGTNESIKAKPAPDAVVKALDQLNVEDDEEIYFVGDSDVDIQTAWNCNLPIIAVSWGFRKKEDLSLMNPDFLIDDPLEILNILNIK